MVEVQLIGFLLLPLIGVAALLIAKFFRKPLNAENTVLAVMLATALLFFVGLVSGFSSFNFMVSNSIDFAFTFSINGLSLPFMLLSIVLPILGLLPARKEIKDNKFAFYILYLLSYMSLIAVFMSSNLLAFFVFWEIVLISFFFIIGFWGEENRRMASMKFLLFTQLGSLLLLGAFILLFIYTGSFNLGVIQSTVGMVPVLISQIIFIFILIAAIIKMPLFPTHVWLPDAHVGAPTVGSILLAGVLLKMGGYVLLQFGVLLFRNIVLGWQPWLMLLGIFTTIYITLVASAQHDFKRIIAYSSVFYMALAFIGMVSLTTIGIYGAVIIMVSHGFIAGMLFTMAGLLKEKTGTRDITKLGGLASKMPLFAMFLMLGVLATIGVPGMSNFIGEFLTILGGYAVYSLSLISLFAVLIATNYYLSAIKRILFGSINKAFKSIVDISSIEALQLGVFSFFIILIGVLPAIIFGGISGI